MTGLLIFQSNNLHNLDSLEKCVLMLKCTLSCNKSQITFIRFHAMIIKGEDYRVYIKKMDGQKFAWLL